MVRRRVSNSVLTNYPKTHRRRVPLSARTTAALPDLPPANPKAVVCPVPSGGSIRLDNWRPRFWVPALEAAEVELRGPHHLRHTFATEALAAGMSIFQLCASWAPSGLRSMPTETVVAL